MSHLKKNLNNGNDENVAIPAKMQLKSSEFNPKEAIKQELKAEQYKTD